MSTARRAVGNVRLGAIIRRRLGAALCGAVLGALGVLPSAALAATITVNTATDENVNNASCSLREAISAAETNSAYGGCTAGSGDDTIVFAIPGGGVKTIAVDSALGSLPSITSGLTIDGWSQGGAAYTGAPLIELNGAAFAAGSGVSGLTIFNNGPDTNAVTVQGLAINRFPNSGLHLFVAKNTTIRGNRIGTDSTGTVDLGNGVFGIYVEDATGGITIGGAGAADRNVIGGHDADDNYGILVYQSSGVAIRGNAIGIGVNGEALGNTTNVFVDRSTGLALGGTAPGEGNVIANGDVAVLVFGNIANSQILGNSVYGNAQHGIDLQDNSFTAGGPTANDPGGDTDTGGNGLQNFPELSSANSTGLVTTVAGTLSSKASQTYRVELFSNPACDSDGRGQGRTFLGATNVATDSSGNASFALDNLAPLPNAHIVTATATGAEGTSEFAPCVTVSAPVPDILVNPQGGLQTTEAGGAAQFQVRLNSVPSAPVSVSVASSDPGEGAASTTVLNFQPNATALNSQTVTVTGVDDALDDGDVAYTIVLGAATSADPAYNTRNAPDVALTNVDNEGGFLVTPLGPLLTNEGGGSATFTVRLTSVPAAAVSVPISSSDPTEGSVSPAILSFQPDATALNPQTVTVTGVDDTLSDGDVAYAILLGAATSTDPGFNGLNPPDVTAANADDELPPVLTIADLTTEEGNGGVRPLRFTATLAPAVAATVTVNYMTADGSATAGAGACAGDYTAASGTLTFAPGETSKDVEVMLCGDQTFEADETLSLILHTPVNATLNRAVGIAIIQNDDAAPPTCQPRPNVRVDTRPLGDGRLGVTLTAQTGPNVPSNRLVSVVPGQMVNGTLVGLPQTMPANAQSVAFEVHRTTPGQATTVPLTVTDGCGAWTTFVGAGPGAFPTLSVADAAAAEGNGGVGTLRFAATLAAPASAPVTVTYATADGTAIGGACAGGADYVAASGSLTFAPGDTSKNVEVTLCGDQAAEPNETLSLTLSAPVNATLARATATGMIQNDDAGCQPRPNVRVDTAPLGNGRLQVTLTAQSNPSIPTNRLVSVAPGPMVNGTLVGLPPALPANAQSVAFEVRRTTPGQATTVPLTVTDGCGAWTTFVGGGPNAF